MRRQCRYRLSWREAHRLEDALKLDDGEFQLWIANRAGRARTPQLGSVSELSSLRVEVSHLRRQVDKLENTLRQRGNTTSRGLDVAAR